MTAPAHFLCRSCGEPATATQFMTGITDVRELSITWHPTNLSDCCGEPLVTAEQLADWADARAEADWYERVTDGQAVGLTERYMTAWSQHQTLHHR